MPDTIRSLATLQGLLADNTSSAISPQDLRDALVSVMPTGRTATKVVAASNSTALEIANADYVCDGTADEVQIQQAIDALDATGGKALLCAGTYNLAAGLLIDANKRIKFEAWGAQLVPAASVTAIRVSQGTGGGALGCVLEGIDIKPSSLNGQTGVEFRDTDRVILRDFRIEDCAVGVLFRSSAAGTGWVEGAKLENGIIEGCTTGWNATVGSGTGSFGETIADNIHINDCTTGINWQVNSNFYRSTLSGVTVWVRNSQTGWIIDGNVRGLRGDIAFESLGTPTSLTGISIGTNASNTMNVNLDIDFEGSFTTRISDAFTKYIKFRYNGQWMTNHVNANYALETRILGDVGPRFSITHNGAAGGGMSLSNGGGGIIGRILAEAQDVLRVYGESAGGILEFDERAAPSAPGADKVRMYARDDAAKTELSALFNTGAVQQAAQQP